MFIDGLIFKKVKSKCQYHTLDLIAPTFKVTSINHFNLLRNSVSIHAEYKVESHKPIRGERLTLNPTEHFQGCCNSDIYVTDGAKVMRAESFGWSECPNEEYAVHSIIYTNEFIKWESIRNKSDFNKELIKEISKTRKSKVEN